MASSIIKVFKENIQAYILIIIISDTMTHYLIEFRFSGYAKYSMKELKKNITKNFGVTRKKIVPHISLAGLFTQVMRND